MKLPPISQDFNDHSQAFTNEMEDWEADDLPSEVACFLDIEDERDDECAICEDYFTVVKNLFTEVPYWSYYIIQKPSAS